MKKSFGCDDESIRMYVENLLKPDSKDMKFSISEASSEGIPDIQVSSLDGRHLEFLAKSINAQKVVEIGTLAGFSGLYLLRGMSEDGRLYTFDINPKNAQVAHRVFSQAGVDHKVVQYVGEALVNLSKIESEGPFDLIFIDADKGNYPKYLEWGKKNLRKDGMIIGDNTFAFGRIADGDPAEAPSVGSLREFNEGLAKDPHFLTTILPTGEGLTVGLKIN